MTKCKLAAAALAAALIFGGGLYIKALRADLARLALATETARQESAGLSRELRLNWEALEQREEARARLAQEAADLKRQLEEIYQNDIEARNWAGGRLPDAVFERLRR